jgi:hypothetical protein
LVPSVSEGILEAYERGIVTSLTAFANRPISSTLLRRAKRHSTLGIGLHLNVTFGEPLSKPGKIPSLVTSEGSFRKMTPQDLNMVRSSELEEEWGLQIRRFQKLWGSLPDHLDSHHHLHAHPKFWAVFLKFVKQLNVPFRLPRSRLSKSLRETFQKKKCLLPNCLWGNLDPGRNWNTRKLTALLRQLKPGIHEIVSHPGFVSGALSRISAFQEGREEELAALTSLEVLEMVRKRNIFLTSFKMLRVL